MKFSDSADEDSLRQLPSDPQSSLSSSNMNEEDSSEAHNVTMMTNDMDGPPLNLIDEGSIKLGTDQGVQFQFVITKYSKSLDGDSLERLKSAGYTDDEMSLYQATRQDNNESGVIKKTGNHTYEVTYDKGITSIQLRSYGNLTPHNLFRWSNGWRSYSL